ncbi:MAG: hypothetical protein KDB07_02115 [Planctomycetes bacterium]|nr:hypothetical protein [Planctomycetota bacterium]
MIKIQASYGLKVPAAEEYSSQSFHASIELELADGADQSHIRGVLQRVWGDLKTAVGEEIHAARAAREPQAQISYRGNGQPSGRSFPSRHGSPNGGHAPEAASKKQIGFLLGTARRKHNWTADQTKDWLQGEFGKDLNQLTKAEAAQAIDALQEQAA